MNTYRLGAMLSTLLAVACLTASADQPPKHHGNDAGKAGMSRSITDPAPIQEQKEGDETKDSDIPASDRDGSRSMHRPSLPTPDAADLTDEEAEAIRKATQ